MKKVSIVMPTYNNDCSLSRTIDSVINQTMEKTNYELIIVDDHSTNSNTLNIIKSYTKKYSKLIKFKRLKFNSGSASKPRNKGIEMSSGQYIFFLDSDDFLHPRALEDLYNYGIKHKSDLIIGKYGVKGKGRSVPKAIFENGNVPKANIIENSMFYALSVLKMFKKAIIDKNKLRFKTFSQTGEDQLFTIEFLMNSRNYAIKTDYEYYVVVNNFDNGTHLSHQKSSGKQYFATINEIYNTIYKSPIYKDPKTRDQFAGKFTTWLFRHGQKKNFAISKMKYEDKIEWLKYFSKTLNSVPRSADQYVTQIFNMKLEAIRQNNLLAVMAADKFIKGE
ncbi:glycosyltransferase family 2 protein [Staphylococcus xylosus]|uniref:glycosyltransferase family 2 protein n=1 Tax=Staphylococcus xylosus TaxID=1288 RepID=UPI002DBBE496|nr:glycosyltransferase family 2 protein [Staphylococcus xylosus]